MNVLVLDNYDSFTYNLVYMLRELGISPAVHRNDQIDMETVGQYDKILLSPGPGIPTEAGIMQDVIAAYAPTKSILGVCLGHQGIGETFGATLMNMPTVYHGVADQAYVVDSSDRLFRGLPDELEVGRYHSWTVVPETMPADLTVTAVDAGGSVMALAHKRYDVRGVQFHPESVLTKYGKQLIQNWLAA
ncbi:MAG TPA: aminodeoxychorismate/anthranilate synthase component II [Fibrella sp.]